MNTKEQLNEILRTDTQCLLADFKVGHKFIIDGEEAFVTRIEHIVRRGGIPIYMYTIESPTGTEWFLPETDLWVRTCDRDIFMNIFRDTDKLNSLSIDDRIEVFMGILSGSSDITAGLLNELINDYNVKGIEAKSTLKSFEVKAKDSKGLWKMGFDAAKDEDEVRRCSNWLFFNDVSNKVNPDECTFTIVNNKIITE